MLLKLTTPLLAALTLSACVIGPQAPQAIAPIASVAPNRVVNVQSADGRAVDLTLVAAEEPVGVLLFSHGARNSPAGLQPVLDVLASQGYAVIAPTHTDSEAMPADRRTDLRGALPTRVADMSAAAVYAEQHYPGMPVGVFGYSYGSLIATVSAGALQPMFDGQVADLAAVVMFSSPGPVAGVTDSPGAFADVTEPTLLVTGTADVVDGFVEDPVAHLVYHNSLPAGDHTALVVTDGTHSFLGGGEPGMDEVAPLVIDFLRSRMLGDGEARARFDAAQSTPRVTISRR